MARSVYLDNLHIASYLAQLQGGAATASASRQSGAELSLTVNDQSRFTSLLGLLQANGYLHTVDMGAPGKVVTRQFAAVTPGSFVKLSDCSLALPSYVQAEQLWRAAKGRISVQSVEEGRGQPLLQQLAIDEAIRDKASAEGKKAPLPPIVGGGVAPVVAEAGQAGKAADGSPREPCRAGSARAAEFVQWEHL